MNIKPNIFAALLLVLSTSHAQAETQRLINIRDMYPSASPDGRQLVFQSNRIGSELQQISHGPWSHAQPAWAFDGQSIYAYQLKETEEYEFGSVVRIVAKIGWMP